MLERQAMDRIHRLGQENEVTIFRYIVDKSDSIEKVRERIKRSHAHPHVPQRWLTWQIVHF